MSVLNPTVESDELTDEQRKKVQLAQSEELTMGGHVRRVLALSRNRLAQTWGVKPDESDTDDDMQLLARDIINVHPPAKENPTPTPPAPSASRWPLALALAAGLGIPSTTGFVMLPSIIQSCFGQPEQPETTNPPAVSVDPDWQLGVSVKDHGE